MEDLIKRIVEAREGSRELSDEVLLAAGWTRGVPVGPTSYGMTGWRAPNGEVLQAAPDPTQNLQDVIDWLVQDVRWEIQRDRTASFATVKDLVETDSKAATPALALTAAALRARKEA